EVDDLAVVVGEVESRGPRDPARHLERRYGQQGLDSAVTDLARIDELRREAAGGRDLDIEDLIARRLVVPAGVQRDAVPQHHQLGAHFFRGGDLRLQVGVGEDGVQRELRLTVELVRIADIDRLQRVDRGV